MDKETLKKASILAWTGPEFPLEVREAAALVYADYVRGKPNSELDFYLQELTFGTGGLRGIIGYGAGRMNLWTVGRTTLGLCKLVKRKHRRPVLVIAYDSRRMSHEFAEATAGIAAGQGLRVYLFREVTPTPILSYAIRKLKAKAGVVITASHNPPEYNGYKVYGADGGQLVGKSQNELETAIQSVKSWAELSFLSAQMAQYKKRVKLIGPQIRKDYIQSIGKLPFVSSPRNPKKSHIKIVYSPLHGSGGGWLVPLLRHYGFHIDMVKEQAKADGEFPTVKYPNPEEPQALYMAEQLARQNQADLFLATDPDADRLGVGVRDTDGGYRYLSGNQIGSIMCAFLCEKFTLNKKFNPRRLKTHIFKTIVTTDLQRRIAEAHSIGVIEVLTGFKYIAEQMRHLDHKRWRECYVFGGEESCGYLPVDFVRDKDALASALLLSEIMVAVGDLIAYLDQLYLRYGLYMEDLKSLTLKGSEGEARIQAAMEKLRNENISNWNLGRRQVVGVLDYQRHLRNGKHEPNIFKNLPYSNVLQFLLEPEGKLTVRPSGTEPKIKFYVSLRHQANLSASQLEHAKQDLQDEIASISGQFITHTNLAGKY